MKAYLNGRLYDTINAAAIAHNMMTGGLTVAITTLYRTEKGNFFLHKIKHLEGGKETLKALSNEDALKWWNKLPEKKMDFSEAFGIKPEEA